MNATHSIANESTMVAASIAALYSCLEQTLAWSPSEIAARVQEHPPAHTVEQWAPYATQLFPGVHLAVLQSFPFFLHDAHTDKPYHLLCFILA